MLFLLTNLTLLVHRSVFMCRPLLTTEIREFTIQEESFEYITGQNPRHEKRHQYGNNYLVCKLQQDQTCSIFSDSSTNSDLLKKNMPDDIFSHLTRLRLKSGN